MPEVGLPARLSRGDRVFFSVIASSPQKNEHEGLDARLASGVREVVEPIVGADDGDLALRRSRGMHATAFMVLLRA